MSLGGGELRSFFGPLTGRTTTFVLEGRQANLAFARTVVGLLASARVACAVLDLDAFYSSNSDIIFSSMGELTAGSSVIRVPTPGADVEVQLSGLFEVQQQVIILDSLNSLYHLISLEDGSSRGRKLTFALSSLSYLARANGKAIVLSMYNREGSYGSGTGRSISSLSDVTALVDASGPELKIRCTRGPAWPGGEFSSRIPSG